MQQGINVHTKRTPSSLSISLTQDFFFFWFPCALTLLPSLPFIYVLSSISAAFLLLFYLLFSLHFLAHAEGWARGSRYTKAWHTHTQRHNSHLTGGMQRASCRRNRDARWRRASEDELPNQRKFNWRVRFWWAALLLECARVLLVATIPVRGERTATGWRSLTVSAIILPTPSGNFIFYTTLHQPRSVFFFNIKKWKTLALQALSSRFTYNTG